MTPFTAVRNQPFLARRRIGKIIIIEYSERTHALAARTLRNVDN